MFVFLRFLKHPPSPPTPTPHSPARKVDFPGPLSEPRYSRSPRRLQPLLRRAYGVTAAKLIAARAVFWFSLASFSLCAP